MSGFICGFAETFLADIYSADWDFPICTGDTFPPLLGQHPFSTVQHKQTSEVLSGYELTCCVLNYTISSQFCLFLISLLTIFVHNLGIAKT